MTVVGITGKSGAGKSRACSYIEQKGYPVIDGDRIAHEELKENNSLQNELIEAFGGKIVKNGELDRKALGSIVFSDDEKLKLLNRISHKYILEHFDRLKEKYQEQGFKAVFIDAAALIESGYPCDAMVFIKADKEFRKSRILDRDNIKENEAEKRIDAQKDDSFYETQSDYIILNNGDEESFKIKIDKLLEDLFNKGGR